MWDGSFFVEDERGRLEEGCQLCGLRKRRPNPNTMNRREADQEKKPEIAKKKTQHMRTSKCSPSEERGSNERSKHKQMKQTFF